MQGIIIPALCYKQKAEKSSKESKGYWKELKPTDELEGYSYS